MNWKDKSVLITGGTGFIGCHTVAALAERGHEVRLLVRNPDRISRALRPLGIEQIDHVAGDVLLHEVLFGDVHPNLAGALDRRLNGGGADDLDQEGITITS